MTTSVPAARRQHLWSEYGSERRRLDEGHVGVPIVVVGKRVGLCLDQSNFRHPFDMAIDGMDVQLAE